MNYIQKVNSEEQLGQGKIPTELFFHNYQAQEKESMTPRMFNSDLSKWNVQHDKVKKHQNLVTSSEGGKRELNTPNIKSAQESR